MGGEADARCEMARRIVYGHASRSACVVCMESTRAGRSSHTPCMHCICGDSYARRKKGATLHKYTPRSIHLPPLHRISTTHTHISAMGFFKRKNEPLIPPVAPAAGQQQPKADPYAAPAAGGYGGGDPYTKSKPAPAATLEEKGGGDPYAATPAYAAGGDPYAKRNPGPRPNPNAANDAARAELFGGFSKAADVPAERKYGYEGREMEEDFDEDEEIEGIKQEMRGVKQDSLASTRNAVALARQAEESARGTIAKLADQSERIANSERYLDMAKANNQRAEDKATELKALSRSIFRPAIVWNKESKRQAQEDKINERHAMERMDRTKALMDVQDTRKRLGAAANPAPYASSPTPEPMPGQQRARKDARSRYQFDATASDDELEDELDENLDETLEVTRRLKGLATAMGDEVSGQNSRLTRVTDKTENLEFAVMKNTERLRRIR
ncbi:synaptosomal-associated protein, 23kDa [Cryptococcus neoformans var. grubii Br795]|uniref:Synaptosomal-associated protein, 23kDa n=1 Tax=Cryptococcus neoformans Tu259-1 TaxID=1230072 RepID=A0A854Q5B9_CRYNE|nr:synaptosomal-associated protein, 23kDa [Cryptococcus neoformans var. grubii 125.91]OXC81484.1 synaptosomal-associated protein, 23kDa [Cryptococcus neoformans var. grubii AD1-7a]OXG11497.1 synaptosomal-associated protein, 23kDa [Cryptococcus neoformans var. grubii Tu259-1]OXG73343.1 synaptosomal-associated protein, 23kDa [Cryptococcus neoformans var. grubii Br795]